MDVQNVARAVVSWRPSHRGQRPVLDGDGDQMPFVGRG